MKKQRFEGIVNLDGPNRYNHFVKWVVGSEEAWGLYDDGWALIGPSDEATDSFPLWPAEEFAAACAVDDWATYTPTGVPLDELIDELLPKLMEDQVGVAVFPTPDGRSVYPDVAALIEDLKNEQLKYT